MIYCVEDDAGIRELVVYTLRNTGFEADGFEDGAALTAALKKCKPQLILLDIMLPGEDGITILRRLRAAPDTAKIPVILLTAKNTEYDKVVGLDTGADDYITKPFSPRELLARIQAHVKRIVKTSRRVLEMGGLTMDLGSREVSVNGRPVSLTKKEFELLEYLLRNPQIVLSRDNILNEIWDFDYDGDTRIVDVHIFKLRNKLQGSGVKIASLRGVGYKLEVQA